MADDPRHQKLYARDPVAAEPNLTGEPPRDAVGTLLRRTREEFGQDLREVSESLRIRYAYLDAIERSAFEELPGPTYAIGFVRGYAQYLGLDDEEIVRRFKQESQGLKRDQELHFPAPVNEGKLPGGTMLVVSLLLIAAAYGAWTYLSSDQRSVADLVPEVPQRLQELVGAEQQPEPPGAAQLAEPAEPAGPATGTGDGDSDGAQAGSETGSPSDRQLAEAPSGDGGDTAASSAPAGDGPSDEATAAPGGGDAGESQPPSGTSGGGTPSGDALPGETVTSVPDAPAPETEASSEPDVPAVPDAERQPGRANGGAAPQPPAGSAPQTAGTETTDTETPTAETPAAGAPQAEGADDGQATASASGPEAPAQDDGGPPAVPEIQQDESGIPTAPEQTQTAASDATQDGREFGADAASSRVSLRATARSWVQVRGPDDSLVLTRMLRPGDIYHVPNRPGLTLHTGNAGGLEVLVDGSSRGRLGGDGEVRRGIVLEPGALP